MHVGMGMSFAGRGNEKDSAGRDTIGNGKRVRTQEFGMGMAEPGMGQPTLRVLIESFGMKVVQKLQCDSSLCYGTEIK
jgi:hypothetical protein